MPAIFNFIITYTTCQHESVYALRGFPKISKVVSFLYYKPVYALSILLPFLKITTAIVIQYVAVDKTAQPIKKENLYTHRQKREQLFAEVEGNSARITLNKGIALGVILVPTDGWIQAILEKITLQSGLLQNLS